MPPQTVKIVAIVAGVMVIIAIGVMWMMSASRPAGLRPGIDIPYRGM